MVSLESLQLIFPSKALLFSSFRGFDICVWNHVHSSTGCLCKSDYKNQNEKYTDLIFFKNFLAIFNEEFVSFVQGVLRKFEVNLPVFLPNSWNNWFYKRKTLFGDLIVGCKLR